jgi:hypothetical protein
MQAEQSRFYKEEQPAQRNTTKINLLKPRSKFGAVVDTSSLTPPEEKRVSRFMRPAIKPMMKTYSKYQTVKRFAREHILDKLDPEIRNKTDGQKRLLQKARARKERVSKFQFYNKITNRQSRKVRIVKNKTHPNI